MSPFPIGERTSDPLKMYLADIFTIAANLAGICGISVPCGFVREGENKLPVGLAVSWKIPRRNPLARYRRRLRTRFRLEQRKSTLISSHRTEIIMAISALCATIERVSVFPTPQFEEFSPSAANLDGLDILTVFLTFKLPNESSVL